MSFGIKEKEKFKFKTDLLQVTMVVCHTEWPKSP